MTTPNATPPADLAAFRAAREAATSDGLAVDIPDPQGYDPIPALPLGAPLVGEGITGERRPIIPAALRGPAAVKATSAHAAGRWAHAVGYHGVRMLSGYYPVIFTGYAARGLYRLARVYLAWLADTRAARMEVYAVDEQEFHAWKGARREGLYATRRALVITAVVLAAVTLATLYVAASPLAPALLTIPPAVLGLLVYVGRPYGKPVVAPATIPPRFRQLTGEVIERAYAAAGLHKPDRLKYPDEQIAYQSAREGAGTRVLVDLPWGLGFDDVHERRDKVASGLDVAPSQVFFTRDPTSHRRHSLWVADRDPLAIPAGVTPLLDLKARDIWEPAPFGVDERGQAVGLLLMWASVLIGALPRQGKTFSARTLGLFAALDPYVRLLVFDGKGSPDWRKFALVAHRCAFGTTRSKAGDPAEILLATLTELKADIEDRNHRLSELPADVCPEGKLTRKIARTPRYKMPVTLLIIDEFHEYYGLDPAVSKRIAELLQFVVKVGPSVGVIVISATQKPAGVGGSTGSATNTMFNGFRDQHGVRFALRTASPTVSNMVLGGATGDGHDSSKLLPSHKGVGILLGASDHTPTVRTFLADQEDAEKILTAARALRERAGTLSGMAAGDDVTAEARDPLAEVLAIFRDGEPGLHWTAVAERLADENREMWAEVTADAISAQLRALGVASVDVKVRGTTLKGCRRTDVETAQNARTD